MDIAVKRVNVKWFLSTFGLNVTLPIFYFFLTVGYNFFMHDKVLIVSDQANACSMLEIKILV